MAAKKGNGLLMVYCDVAAEHEDEFNRWYNEEHIPERLAIAGVLDAARYKAVEGGPTYLACYELQSADLVFGGLAAMVESSHSLVPADVPEHHRHVIHSEPVPTHLPPRHPAGDCRG
jgi:hypothetical protein